MAVRFELKEFGNSFATRGRGEAVRQELLTRAGGARRVVVDLAGVEQMSYSFADELLGRLSAEEGLSLDIEGASPNVSRTIENAIRRRTPSAVSC